MVDNVVSVRLETDSKQFVDSLGEAAKSFENLGRFAKLNSDHVARLSRALDDNRGSVQRSSKAIEKQASALKNTFEVSAAGTRNMVSAFGDATKMSEQSAQAIAEAGQTVFRVFSENETVVARFGRTTGQTLKGIEEGFENTFKGKFPFSLQQAEEAFQSFQKSLSTGLESLFFGALSEENTKAFKARWGKFLDEIEDAFLKSLAKMASALVQENLLAA